MTVISRLNNEMRGYDNSNPFQMWLREATVFCNTVWELKLQRNASAAQRPQGAVFEGSPGAKQAFPWSLLNAGECLGINKLLNERTADKQGETLLVWAPCGRTCFPQKNRPQVSTKGWNSSDCLNVRLGLLKGISETKDQWLGSTCHPTPQKF